MLQRCSIWTIASVFFLEPTKQHYLMELSRKTKLAHTSVKKHLEMLKEENIVKETSETKNTRTYPIYTANLEHSNYLSYKKIFNLEQIHKSKIITKLIDIYQPETIILFGSYVRGEDIETSDIDIFIDTTAKKEINTKKYEQQLQRKIELHVNKFENLPKELQNNILNGIVIYGYIEAITDEKSSNR